jgi:hypothetical protein
MEAKASYFSIYRGKECFYMKLTKERLVQIIKEEMELSELTSDVTGATTAPQSSATNTEPDPLSTKNELSLKLIQLAKEIRGLKGLDSTEITELDQIFNRLIVLAEKGSVGSALRALNKRIPDGQ